jgi:hypothetical protein
VTGNARRTIHSFTPSSKEFPKKRKEKKRKKEKKEANWLQFSNDYIIYYSYTSGALGGAGSFLVSFNLGNPCIIQNDILDMRWRRTRQQHVNINLSIYMMHTRSIQLRTVR